MTAFMVMIALSVGVFTPWAQDSGRAAPAQDQQVLAVRLTNGSEAERFAAIRTVLSLQPEQWAPDVINALGVELRRLKRESDDRRARLAAGETGLGEESQYLPLVVQAAGQSAAPQLLGPMAGFIERGDLVRRGLLLHGEAALSLVLTIATSEVDSQRVSGALQTLGMMVRGDGDFQLDERGTGEIRRVAEQRLHGTQAFVSITSAARLAIALDDEHLKVRVELLANDPAALRDMGIVEERWISRLQERLTILLRGQTP